MEMVLGLDMNRAGGGGSGRAIPSNVLTAKDGTPLQSKDGLYLTSKTGTTRMYIADYLNSITSTELSEVRTAWRRIGPVQLMGQSGVAVNGAADANENILGTITIPAGLLLANDALAITTMWSFTGSTNSKTLRVRLGGIAGTQFLNSARTGATEQVAQILTVIRNRAAVNSQVGYSASLTTSYGVGSSVTVATGAINMANAQDIVITGQKATAGETITLESYSVELLRSPV